MKGFRAPAGFRLQIVAGDDLLAAPSAMCFDDSGRAYVVESPPSGHQFDVWESVALPDGSKARLHRRRKATTDRVKRLIDADADGVFDGAEVVLEGVENPSALLWLKDSFYLAASGRLERWDDADADGRFETRSVLVDGLGGVDGRGLSGLTLGADGLFYLTTGDNDVEAFAAEGSPIKLSRTGGIFRCRPDGSDLKLMATGFRRLRGGVQFDGDFQPVVLDDDGLDGSRVGGVRLVQPAEAGDYGWRLLPGAGRQPDHDLAAVDGDRPGKLAGFARLAGAAPSSFVVYNGPALSEACRGLFVAADPARHAVRGLKVQPGATPNLVGEATLLQADERFRPEQVLVGANSALYILDRRGPASKGQGVEPGEAAGGRIYRLVHSTDPDPRKMPALLPNTWDRVRVMPTDRLVAEVLPGPDLGAAERALREVVERGVAGRVALLAAGNNPALPPQARMLAILGARQLWADEVELNLAALLRDPRPEIRRLAVQGLGRDARGALARVAAKLVEHLDDPDDRVVRELALAIARHGEANPRQYAPVLVRWLFAHPKADAATRDAVVRAVERLGGAGVDEFKIAVRTRRGTDRAEAVRLFGMLRSEGAADELTGLVKIPDLSAADRSALVRQFASFPVDLPVATTGVVDWILKHDDVEPAVKLAAMETCRLVGNPASALLLALLDDDDEAVRVAATVLAGRTKPPGAMKRLTDRLGDDSLSETERLAIARGLRLAGVPTFPVLDAAYVGSENLDFRRAALRAMADIDRPRAIAGLTSALSGPDPALRRDAMAILGETPEGAEAVGRAYLDRALGRDDLPAVLAALRPHKADAVRKLQAEVVRDASEGSSKLDPSALRLRAVEEGNPWAGLEVFFRASTRCASCHQVGGKGGDAGPALDVATHGLNAEKLIESIQHPSRAIKPAYEPPRVAAIDSKGKGRAKDAKDGTRKVAEAPRLASNEGRDHAEGGRPAGLAPLAGVERARPEAEAKPGHPAMPAGLDLELTPRELADLVAFLLDASAQGAVKQGLVVGLEQWAVAGPLAPGADSLRAPLDRVDPGKPLPGPDGRKVRWTPLRATEAGRVDLGGFLPVEPGRAYAATQLRAESAQAAWLYASTRGAARVYLNGAKIADLPDRSLTLPSRRPGRPPRARRGRAARAQARLEPRHGCARFPRERRAAGRPPPGLGQTRRGPCPEDGRPEGGPGRAGRGGAGTRNEAQAGAEIETDRRACPPRSEGVR